VILGSAPSAIVLVLVVVLDGIDVWLCPAVILGSVPFGVSSTTQNEAPGERRGALPALTGFNTLSIM
jgi:hypothetical protein